jgi:DNA-binding transcriptional ArsR family regulator
MADKRTATADELKAMGHPLRMRIIRLCHDEPRTNKELAALLRKDPATVLHHVRLLTRHGFLEPLAPRSGARGALEKPYRGTGLSWTLDLGTDESTLAAQVEVAVVEAHRQELAEAVAERGPDAILTQSRLPCRLDDAGLAELRERLRAVVADFAERDDPGGVRVSMLISVHERPTAG